MSDRVVAVALTRDERDLAVAALRELAGRRDGRERTRALEVAGMLRAAVSTRDVAVQLALTDGEAAA